MSAIIQASPLENLSQQQLTPGDSCVLIIFGASGDLTARKLIPSLYNLACEGCMNPDFEVLGIGRTPMSSGEFRKKTGEAAAKSKDTRDFSELGWKDFERRVQYMVGDVNEPKFYPQLRGHLNEMEKTGSSPNHLFYVSTPASVAGPIIEGLGAIGLNRRDHGWTRIVLEKPFGRDLDSAQGLNEVVHGVFDEKAVYRIDHYLGKETVQNISSSASATRCSSRGGIGITSIMWRLPQLKRWESKAARRSTKKPAPCAIWWRTTCFSCWRSL